MDKLFRSKDAQPCVSTFILVIFLMFSCASIPHRPIETKLDLSAERQLVEDLKNIDPEQKQIILHAFDRADTFTESIRISAKELESQNAKLKSNLESEREDAEAYRRWRNWVLGIGFAFLLWQLRGFILPIVKRLMGIPV